MEIDGGRLTFTAQTPEGSVFDTFTLTLATSGAESNEFVPAPASGLGSVYPNPSNPNTKIAFQLNAEHNVDLTICDLKGRLIKRLLAGQQFEAGKHDRSWNGEDDAGSPVASGVYLVRLSVDGRVTGPLRNNLCHCQTFKV